MIVCESNEKGSIEITPASTRREGFPGALITLADGREWQLAFPAIRYMPQFTGDVAEPIKVLTIWGYPPNVEEDLNALAKTMAETPDEVPLRMLFRVMAGLLRLSHEISDRAACELLVCEAGDFPRYFAAINEALQGTPDEPAEASE